MEKIFLYSGIYNWNVEEILQKMNDFGDDKDITYRLNSGGGDVFAAQGWLADMRKRKGKNIGAIEGNASSMAFMLAISMDSCTALETSKALIHRAYMWVSNEEDRKMLEDVNEQFKSAIRAKLNVPALEQRLGMSLDAFFYAGEKNEVRHEAWLSASDMVAIGLVKEEDVLKITPELAADIGIKKTAMFDGYRENITPQTVVASQTANVTQVDNSNNNNQNNKKMDTAEVKAAQDAAVQAEKARVEAWMVFADVDLAKVKAGIESGKDITAKEMGEFVLARTNAINLNAIENNSPDAVTTAEEQRVAAQKEVEQEEKALLEGLGISK